MLKKAKADFGMRQFDQAREFSQAALKSSHEIWLAGLGAFGRAQREGVKMFEALVRQGQLLEQRTRQAATDTAQAAQDAARAKAKEMHEMAGGTWDKLEQVFEDRVARALSKLGVYTQNDVRLLADRVDELSEAVNALLKASGAAPATGRARKAAKARGAGAAAKKPAAPKPRARKAAKAAPKKATRAAKRAKAPKAAAPGAPAA